MFLEIDFIARWKLADYAKKAYYELKDVQGGKKADLSEILKDRISKILDTINFKTQGQLWVEVALGFDGAGSYKEFGRKNDPDQKNQIFGNSERFSNHAQIWCDKQCYQLYNKNIVKATV